jgi:cytochrome c oxidase subunit II
MSLSVPVPAGSIGARVTRLTARRTGSHLAAVSGVTAPVWSSLVEVFTLAVNTRDVYDGLAALYVPIAVAVFVLIVLALAWFVLTGRRRSAPRGPEERNGLELAIAGLLAAVVAVLVVATFRALDRESAAASGDRVVVRVVAAKWDWRFEYPNGHVETGARNGAPAQLTVPAGEQVEFRATSLDVIHAFWIPALKFQRQLIPGRETTFRLVFPRPGFATSGTCSFFCGLDHARMRFSIRVLSRDEYEAWAR